MLIAYDLGTTGNKASLHHDDGRLVSAVTVGYGVNSAVGEVHAVPDRDRAHEATVVVVERSLVARRAQVVRNQHGRCPFSVVRGLRVEPAGAERHDVPNR